MIQPTTMVYYLNDYKGKWYVISDEPDSMYGDIGTMTDEEITDAFLEVHAQNCLYYGIPMYHGKNQELLDRCEAASSVAVESQL